MTHLTLEKTFITATTDGTLEIRKTHAHDRMGRHEALGELSAPVILDRVDAHRLAKFIIASIPLPM